MQIGDIINLNKYLDLHVDRKRDAEVIAVYPNYVLCERTTNKHGTYYECVNVRTDGSMEAFVPMGRGTHRLN